MLVSGSGKSGRDDCLGAKTGFWAAVAKIAFCACFLLGLFALIQLFPSVGKTGEGDHYDTVQGIRRLGGRFLPSSGKFERLRTRLNSEQEHTHTHADTGVSGVTKPPGDEYIRITHRDPSGCPPQSPNCKAAAPIVVKTKTEKPPRDAAWVEEQRPLPDSGEREFTSHVFEELGQHSLVPPMRFEEITSDASELAELESRLVIGIAMGVTSHRLEAKVQEKGLYGLPVFETLLPTFIATIQPHHIYRFYLAYDHDDVVYDNADMRQQVEDEFYRFMANETEKRWHPEGHIIGKSIDSSTLLVTLHFVHCDYKGKPAWAHSDAVVAAYKEGADYVYRTNDDTAFPSQGDWVDQFIIDLRGRAIPNLGVVGPYCGKGATSILTHDFTHRTHVIIFGFEYPRSLPGWSSDDWVTFVYEQFGLMSKLASVSVYHKVEFQRYNEEEQAKRLLSLNKELETGAATINAWVQEHHGKTLPFTLKHVTCC